MSVSSCGFITKQQEAQYNKDLYSLIFLVQNSLARILASNSDGQDLLQKENFRKYFKKIYEKVTSQEQYKYAPPKFGSAFRDLAQLYGLNTDANKEMKYFDRSLSEKKIKRINSNEKFETNQNLFVKDDLEFELRIKLKKLPERQVLKSASTTSGIREILSKIKHKPQSRLLGDSEYCNSWDRNNFTRQFKGKKNLLNNKSFNSSGLLKTRNKSIPCGRFCMQSSYQSDSKPYCYAEEKNEAASSPFLKQKSQYLVNKVGNKNKFVRKSTKNVNTMANSSSNSSLEQIVETPETVKKSVRMDSKAKEMFYKLKNKDMKRHRERLLKLYNTMDS
ncbi:unnamed protein product [Moneuplotes crassus]|uniref:Uncharacterized protein n=1 Tax=Euplotes crassus TaxID=5936 RepID=A0AAD1URT4_EUPCR|nr:unnamed protein product [Moneuplotes crassus]